MFKFQPDGRLECEETPFINGKIIFKFSDRELCSSKMIWVKKENFFQAIDQDIIFNVTAGRSFNIELVNNGSEDLFWVEATISFIASEMKSDLDAADYYEYIHSFNFGKNSGVKKVGLSNRWITDHNPESSMLYLLCELETSDSMLFAVTPLGMGDYISFKALHEAGHMEGRFGLQIKSEQQRLLRHGEKAAMTGITLVTGNDPVKMIGEYGEDYGEAIRQGKALKNIRYGWNSWDYFSGAVSSDDIFKNQQAALLHFGGSVTDFVIDEGWEPRWGDWVANYKFPEGLEGYCEKINANGGTPGIWTAPLMVNTYTGMYRNHPEWFGRDNAGNIVNDSYSYGPMAFLDPTHPEAAEYLHETYSRLKNNGFSYFKVDFTQEILKCAKFHDMSIGRAGIIRRAFEIIRSAIGNDAYLLACGAPFESVTGIVDCVRTSGDIHNYWSHIAGNAGGISSRWWMTRNLWNTDPDFMIVRNPDTSDDKMMNKASKPNPFNVGWLLGREMNNIETMTYALMVYLSCGDIYFGDDLGKLNNNGIEMIRKIIESPKLTSAAVPVDMFKSHNRMPEIWVAREGNFAVFGLFNWEEDSVEKVIDLEALGFAEDVKITSLWESQDFKPENGKLRFKLTPRSSMGLVIKSGK